MPSLRDIELLAYTTTNVVEASFTDIISSLPFDHGELTIAQ